MKRELQRAAREIAKYKEKLGKEIQKAEVKTAKVGLRAAIQQSSGNTSLAQLRKEDHPFAKRHGEPKRDVTIINSHSRNGFKSEWHIDTSRSLEDGPAVVNYSKVAGFLQEGTRKMFARPIEGKVIAAMSKVRVQNLDQAVSKAG